MTKESLIQEIESFRDLDPNWNSYACGAVNPRAIDGAIEWINAAPGAILSHYITAVPTESGGIQLEPRPKYGVVVTFDYEG